MDEKCGCKGIRSCLICKPEEKHNTNCLPIECELYYFCIKCKDKAWIDECHDNHTGKDNIEIKGIFVAEDVITRDEEMKLVMQIDNYPWCLSQSGRRKQDFGPKVNFRKQKLKIGNFRGFPEFAHLLFESLSRKYSILDGFIPVELCHLEYTPDRGSSIDPHLDDIWLWGNRLVTVNLLSSTYLTLTPIDRTCKFEIRILMKSRSLVVISSQARYQLNHSIKREHIISRRIGMTYRELTPLFLPNGKEYESIGKYLIQTASNRIF